MAYSQNQLQETTVAIIGLKQAQTLGLARATWESSVQLFLNNDADPEAIRIIREAGLDLRDFGKFRFAEK